GEGGGGEPEPPPPPFEADLVADQTNPSASDANNCAPATPCKTVNRVLTRASELAPSVVDVYIGPGIYLETSFLNPSNNLGEVRGAGINETIIKAAPNLYFNISTAPSGTRGNLNNFFVNYNRTTHATVTTKFK